MSQQHVLMGRDASEVLWFQRRSLIHAAAAWAASGGIGAAVAQQSSNIVELSGDAMVNGKKLLPNAIIQTGDSIETGPKSNLVFVVGNAGFQMRQNSRMKLERGNTLSAVSLLRLLSGAVVSVWGKGNNRTITTPTITAGIRGTGVYAEVYEKQDGRSYMCNCYGTVDAASGKERRVSVSQYHQSFWGEREPKEGKVLMPAKALNHTDDEVEFLARLVNQRTAWQIVGKKGVFNGSGYIEP